MKVHHLTVEEACRSLQSSGIFLTEELRKAVQRRILRTTA